LPWQTNRCQQQYYVAAAREYIPSFAPAGVGGTPPLPIATPPFVEIISLKGNMQTF
jgi:hypothetical protein